MSEIVVKRGDSYWTCKFYGGGEGSTCCLSGRDNCPGPGKPGCKLLDGPVTVRLEAK